MTAAALLKKFARNGLVIEGRGRLAAAAVATILSLGAAAPAHAAGRAVYYGASAERAVSLRYGQEQPDLPAMGILHDKSHPRVTGFTRRDDPGQPVSGAAAMLDNRNGKSVTIDYSAMVKDIQTQVDAEFPGKIHIVDRSKPAADEAAKIAQLTGKALSERELFIIGGDPHSSPAIGPNGAVCLVIGPQPDLDVRDMTAGYVEEMMGSDQPLDFKGGSGVTDEVWHRLMLWHEVGHCLTGSLESRADAFSMLKMMSELKRTDFVDVLIAVRELMERVSTPYDDHIISPTLRNALQSYGNAEFMEKPHTLRELGAIADKLEVSIDAHAILIRNWLAMTRYDEKRKDFDLKRTDYLVPVKEGYVVANFDGWLKAAASIPEVGRIRELLNYLTGDPATRKAPGPFNTDRAASAKAVEALAEAGDPTIRDIAPVFGVTNFSSDVPLSGTDALPSHADVPGRLIAFDRTAAVVKFSKDLRSFLVRNSATRHPVVAGDCDHGITKTFEGLHDRTHTAESSYAGPRR